MVEFTDLECPFCRQFHVTAFQEIKKNYIDTGKVRFVTHDFPLGFHPNAKSAAVAARCGAEQDKFWELRDALSKNADKLSPQAVLGHAAGLGLEMKKFQACVDSKKFEGELQKDQDAATAAGVSGTPMFLIGKTNSSDEAWKITGAMPYAVFDARIKQLLEEPAAAR
jgi:protein-disulfide isomerase